MHRVTKSPIWESFYFAGANLQTNFEVFKLFFFIFASIKLIMFRWTYPTPNLTFEF